MSDEETIQERVARLREDLRNGRRAGETTDVASQDAGNSHSAARGSLQVLPGKGQRTGTSNRLSNGAVGSSQEKPVRVGQSDRRSGDSDEGTTSDVQSGGRNRRAGRLVSDGPIPDRLPDYENGYKAEAKRYQEDYKRGNRSKDGHVYKVYYRIGDPEEALSPEEYKQLPSRKQEQREQAKAAKEATKAETAEPGREKRRGFFNLGKDGSTLSKSEVNALREPFTAALKDDCKYLDEALWWYSKDASQPQIWSDIDDEELETLAMVLLKRGERSPAAATFVRNVVEGHDYLEVAIITVPRFIKTGQQMSKRPKQPKRERVKR